MSGRKLQYILKCCARRKRRPERKDVIQTFRINLALDHTQRRDIGRRALP